MIDVTHKLRAAKRNAANGITWVQLAGEDEFGWVVVSGHPDAPTGFVAIGGANNGSCRLVAKYALDKLLTAVQ